MNRNAARHLALVVSILLCFFVYMGYRYWGRSTAQEEIDSFPTELVQNTGNAQGSSSALRPGGDAPTGSLSLAPPPGNGGTPVPSDVSYPIGSIDEQLSLAPPSGIPAPPSGSIEESESGPGEITGLVPAPPLTPPSGGSRAETESPLSMPPGGLAPPGSGSSGNGSSLPPSSGSMGGNGASAGVAESRTGPGLLAPPPSSPLRPSATAEVQEVREAPVSTPAPPSVRPDTPAVTAPPRSGVASPVVPPATRPPAPVGPATTPTGNMPVSDSLRIYVVQPGDTLSRIAARELGSIALADNIFLMNRDVISDPDHLMAGVRIRLPIRETLPGAAGVAGRGESERRVVHRVQRGETLSSIAARYYGSSSAWQFLHQANVSVVPNPNQLSVGMELIIPPYEEVR